MSHLIELEQAIAEAIAAFVPTCKTPTIPVAELLKVIQQVRTEHPANFNDQILSLIGQHFRFADRLPEHQIGCPKCLQIGPIESFSGWEVSLGDDFDDADDNSWENGGSGGPVETGHLEVGDWNGSVYEFDGEVSLYHCPNCGTRFATE